MLRIWSIVSCVFILACARAEAPHGLDDADAGGAGRHAAGSGSGSGEAGRDAAVGGWDAPLPAGSGAAGDAAAGSGAAGDGAAGSGERVCGSGGWCWAHGASIHAMATGSGTVFAVGAGGAVLEWRDGRFQSLPAFTSEGLNSVWLSGPNDVWVTSYQHDVFHYDGMRWKQLAVRGHKVTGTGPNDVWVGMQHYDGTRWQKHEVPQITVLGDALALGPKDVWVLAQVEPVPGSTVAEGYTAVLRFDGSQWQQVGQRIEPSVGYTRLVRVAGEVWIHASTIAYRLEGQVWRHRPMLYGFDAWSVAMSGTPEREVIRLFDGQDVVEVPPETRCRSALRVRDGESFCFSEQGQLYRFDGAAWQRTFQDAYGTTLSAPEWGQVAPELWAGEAKLAWGSAADDVLRVRTLATNDHDPEDVLEHYDGARWSELARGRFWDITGSARDNVWIVGKQLLHWDGVALREITRPDEVLDGGLTAAISFGPRATFFVADLNNQSEAVMRYDGDWSVMFTRSKTPPDITAFERLVGSGESDLWLVATRQRGLRELGTGAVFHYDGSTWQSVALWSTSGMTGIAVDTENVWVSDVSGVYRLPRASVMSTPVHDNTGNTFAVPNGDMPVSMHRARLWRGPNDLWLTTGHQAMRLPL
jgi:hypothetical protein